MRFQKPFSILLLLFILVPLARIPMRPLTQTASAEASFVEDFNTFTEVDPNNVITKTSSRVDWDHMDRSHEYRVYKSYGQDHLGDFQHKFEFEFTRIEAGTTGSRFIVILWQLNTVSTRIGDDRICFYANQVSSIDDRFTLVFYELAGGEYTFAFFGDFEFSTDTTYYATLTRNGSTSR